MDKEVLSENGCGKLHFLGLKLGSGFEEPGGTPHQEFPGVGRRGGGGGGGGPPPQEFPGLPPPPPPPPRRTQTAQLM